MGDVVAILARYSGDTLAGIGIFAPAGASTLSAASWCFDCMWWSFLIVIDVFRSFELVAVCQRFGEN